MYLRSISVKGFKSFADRTVLSFEPGISVIVGPNGSGKSNIADAVLWVLGEQSARSLRGGKMEDVIFAGSSSRPALGMAEVSLSVDNTAGTIPLEYSEVVITRQIYRSGESEYLLNNTPCRLTDIQELLSDLGMGKELTAVIGQGKLESIIGSRPEDRRAFLEEAAGLLKHRRRKDKALRKLAATEQNLLRVNDIIGEVRKQLRPLERQAKVAEEYRGLERRLRELNIRLVVKELDSQQTTWQARRAEQESKRKQLEATQGWLAEGRVRLSGLEEEAAAARREGDELRQKEYALLSTGQKLESELNLSREKIRLYGALQARPPAEQGELLRELEQGRAAAEVAAQELQLLETEWQASREERTRLAAGLKEVRSEQAGVATELQELRQRQALAIQSLEVHRESLQRAAGRQAEAQGRLQEAGPGMQAARAELEEAGARLAGLKEHETSLGARIEELYAALKKARERCKKAQERKHESEREEALAAARLQAIEEMLEKRGDHAAAAERVLAMHERLPGVHGMLLDLIEIRPEWEHAIESYLGRWIFGVVVEDLRDAVSAIRALKKEKGGMGVFLPLRELAGLSGEPASYVNVPGAIPAVEAVKCKSEAVRPAVEFLLSRVMLTGSLDQAASASKTYRHLAFVTREGDVVAVRQMVKGGTSARGCGELAAKRREVEHLRAVLAGLERQQAHLQVEGDAAQSLLAELEAELEDEKTALASLLPRLREAERECGALELREAELRHDERISQALLQELREEESLLCREWEKQQAGLDGLQEARDVAEGRRREISERLEPLEALWAEFTSREERLKERLVAARERAKHLRERLEELERRQAEWENHPLESASVAGKMDALEKLSAMLEGMMSFCAADREAVAAQRAECGARLEHAEEEAATLKECLVQEEARLETLREALHHWELEATELKLKVDALVQRLLDEFQISVEAAIAEHLVPDSLQEMRQEMRLLEERRQVLGPVNLLAEREFEALNARRRFLEEQVEDLKQSKSSLSTVVRAIDREIARIFTETYEEVNRHFQELFAFLFANGRAELSLTNPDDLLNSGVEIQAQPYGKRVKKLSLLSGGEMALTSLAFLFAIFKTRPSPFYFLDEVEAALDDVNLHRFLNMLRQFEKDSQLVIITHQKRTMEIADILYGVSMQAEGVSRAVSLRLSRDGLADASA